MKDIALRSDFPVDVGSQMQMCQALAQAGVLPSHLRRQPANIMAIGMAARALDIPTWTALQQVVPVDGKTTLQADLMRALILRAGHKFRVEEATAQTATCVVIRHDDPDYEHRVTVNYDEIPDELRKKANWKNYTADMLVARCTAKVARRSCSDVLNGMIYTPDELGADVDDDGNVVHLPTTAQPPAPEPQQPSAAAQRATSAAERLRAAADAETAAPTAQEPTQDGQQVNADGTVDAEVVEEGDDDQPAAAQDAADAPADVDQATGEVQQPEAETFPESHDGDPFAGPREPHNMTPLRKAIYAQAEGRWGAEQWRAEIEAHFAEAVDFVDTRQLREFVCGKAS